MLCPQCGKSLTCEKVTLCEQCEGAAGVSQAETDGELIHGSESAVGLNHDAYADDNEVHDDYGNAGFWIRVVAAIADGVCLQLAALITGLLISSITSVGMLATSLFESVSPVLGDFGFFLAVYVIYVLTLILLSLLYYPLFEISPLRATPGKYILGLEVCKFDNKKVGFFVALLRQFLRSIGFLFFLIGPLMCAFSRDKLALHDLLTNTKTRKKEQKSILWVLSVLFVSFGAYIVLAIVSKPASDKSGPIDFNRSGSPGLKAGYEIKKIKSKKELDQWMNKKQQDNNPSSFNDTLRNVTPANSLEQLPKPANQDATKKSEIKKKVVEEKKSETQEDDIYSLDEFERARLLRQRKKNEELN